MSSFIRPLPVLALAISCLAAAALVPAAEKEPATGKGPAGEKPLGPEAQSFKRAREKGIQFLRTSQAEDGSWTTSKSAGLQGLLVYALLRSGVKRDDPTAVKGLKHLESFVQRDGGIYEPQSDHRNYETSLALLALSEANADGKYKATISGARDFLKGLQFDESKGTPRADAKFGGQGYGSKSSRPDLSNTAFLLDALAAAGVKSDDEAMKNAVVFVSRCQNLETENNNTEFAAKINDGGFFYSPVGTGSSPAGKEPNGGLRSYGAMTYAGLKSMVHAGLKPDDPRVTAAYKWVQKHYSVAENPGMGQAGLFYYYHTFAKALDTMKLPLLEDARGVKHDWRKELGEHLIKLQKENGSWVNNDAHWMEGDPNMVTAFALLALSHCQ